MLDTVLISNAASQKIADPLDLKPKTNELKLGVLEMRKKFSDVVEKLKESEEKVLGLTEKIEDLENGEMVLKSVNRLLEQN